MKELSNELMSLAQQQVHDFFLAVDQIPGDYTDPKFPDQQSLSLGYDLVREEVVETLEAIDQFNLVEVADGIADSIFVLLGLAVRCGIDMGPIWTEVVRTNMEKTTGPVDSNGKRLKPEGWQPPNIEAILLAQKNPATN